MNFEDYKTQRATLMENLNSLIEEGKLDDVEAVQKQVTDLDESWDKIATAMANAKALEDKVPKAPDLEAAAIKEEPAEPVETMKGENSTMNYTPETAYKAPEYVNAWAKAMMGKKNTMTEEETTVYNMVDEYTHTTENAGVVIPESVAQGIWSEIEDMFPYYADITKTTVPGILSIIQATDTTDAAWYDEATAAEDATETFAKLQLSGCELSRAVTVSWKLRDMAISDFIPYIQRRLAERMGAALGYGVTNGQGPDADKPEPTGIITALVADGNQVVSYSGTITYANLTAARAKIKSGYSAGLAIYATADTIWNILANVVDNNGRPIFIADPSGSGVYRIFGVPVKEDASIGDGNVLISNAGRGYQANISRDISVVTEEHAKARTVDYVGYAIIDGAPLTLKAHALLTAGASSGSTGSDTESDG